MTIQDLHEAYLSAMGMEPSDLPLNGSAQRYYYDALNEGVTPDAIKLVIKARIKFNNTQRDIRYKKPLTLLRLFGDVDAIGNFLNEAAIIRAEMRKARFTPEKSAALRATGRSDEPNTEPAQHVSNIRLIEDLRKAANQ